MTHDRRLDFCAVGGWLDFDGLEGVALAIGLADEFKEEGGGGVEDVVEEGVGFHGDNRRNELRERS